MMNYQLFISEFDKSKTFYKKRLLFNRNEIKVVNSVSVLYSQLDSIVKGVISNPVNQFDCKKGCTHCCSLRVEVLGPEAFYIASQIKKSKKFNKDEVINALKKQTDYAKGKKKEEYLYPCAFLRDGTCSIYSNRPFMCRKLLSFDVEECKKEEREPPESTELFSKSQGLGLGFAEAYEHYKFQSEPTEFSQAIRKVLMEDSLVKTWFKGGAVFEPAP